MGNNISQVKADYELALQKLYKDNYRTKIQVSVVMAVLIICHVVMLVYYFSSIVTSFIAIAGILLYGFIMFKYVSFPYAHRQNFRNINKLATEEELKTHRVISAIKLSSGIVMRTNKKSSLTGGYLIVSADDSELYDKVDSNLVKGFGKKTGQTLMGFHYWDFSKI
ncbi:MAG: hypothetical protein ABF709_06380 [Leuconostoc pseudomesenteroides]|uniref:hypothetical protein n=1 Tax=Leuconostoc pseudomesenteroides TaxID=33968 RepID=UPI001E407D5C|nr:hypothetical protein [Leuconostoc pseudomesenteroides]MCC7669249.1 hypothetical protein [Leuconostoc pseudomesenteroides]